MAKKKVEPEPVVDPTGWMVSSAVAEFLLMNTDEIKYLIVFGYAFFHGNKLFPTFNPGSSVTYKFVSMIFTCTGGGIIVPVVLNLIPVPLSQDMFVIMVIAAFLLHLYVPIARDIYKYSPIMKVAAIVMFETLRAFIMTKFATIAAETIPASSFSFPVFGPIFCGTLGGCGGIFLPLNKGLNPILKGPAPPVQTAFIAAAAFHLYLQSSWSDGVIEARKKAQFIVSLFFILSGLANTFDWKIPGGHHVGVPTTKKED